MLSPSLLVTITLVIPAFTPDTVILALSVILLFALAILVFLDSTPVTSISGSYIKFNCLLYPFISIESFGFNVIWFVSNLVPSTPTLTAGLLFTPNAFPSCPLVPSPQA